MANSPARGWGGSFGRVRRVRRQRARNPDRRCQAKLILSASCGIEGASAFLQAVARCAIDRVEAGPLPDPAAAGAVMRIWSPAAIATGPRPRPRPNPRPAPTRPRPIRSYSLYVGHDRHPKASCGPWRLCRGPSGAWAKSYGLAPARPCHRVRRRLGRRPCYIVYRRCSGAAPRCCTRASRSARPTPARCGAWCATMASMCCSPHRPRSGRSRREDRRGVHSRRPARGFRVVGGERCDPPTLDGRRTSRLR